MRKIFLLAAVILLFSSCNIVEIDHPETDKNNFLSQTRPLTEASKKIMNGVYRVTAGNDFFGETVVLKWSGNYLSVFTSRNAGFMVMQGGSLDSTLFFLGHWRFAQSSSTGLVDFYISNFEGGRKILSGDTTDLEIIFQGVFGDENLVPGRELVFEYLRPFSDSVMQSDFQIIAHRGGGRNSEYLGASENSVEMISLAEQFGSTGIEIDVQLSKDNIPILYHDKDINLRLTQKSVIWGDVEDFTFAQLRAFVKLKNGEKIPSLREALDYVLNHTSLSLVWLDLKSARNEIPIVAELQKEFIQKASMLGRNLEILIGIASVDKMNSLSVYPNFQSIPTLSELNVELTRNINAKAWAPRWTLGIQLNEVRQVHGEGRKAFVWTLDDASFIDLYLREGEFDGILTNYPSTVAYYHYIR